MMEPARLRCSSPTLARAALIAILLGLCDGGCAESSDEQRCAAIARDMARDAVNAALGEGQCSWRTTMLVDCFYRQERCDPDNRGAESCSCRVTYDRDFWRVTERAYVCESC